MRGAVLVLLVGCASSFQSAHPLQPGKTQVTAGLSGVKPTDGDGQLFVGDLQVRHGLADKIDGGVKLVRTPGAVETVSAFAADVKFQLNEAGGKTAVSLGIPVGAAWVEEQGEFNDGILILGPTLFIGTELAPNLELVFAPSIVLVLPEGGTSDSEIEVAATLGLRFTDPSRTWAIQPEVGLTHFNEGESPTFVTFGVGVSVGD
jgi:hypothetical protein